MGYVRTYIASHVQQQAFYFGKLSALDGWMKIEVWRCRCGHDRIVDALVCAIWEGVLGRKVEVDVSADEGEDLAISAYAEFDTIYQATPFAQSSSPAPAPAPWEVFSPPLFASAPPITWSAPAPWTPDV